MEKSIFICKKACTAIYFLTNNKQRGLCMDKKPAGGVEESHILTVLGPSIDDKHSMFYGKMLLGKLFPLVKHISNAV